MPDVSIIILTYRSADVLAELLATIPGAMERFDYECIVVDNASPDHAPTADLVQQHGATLIRNERNLGFGAGFNVGIRAARGRYLALLNPDLRLSANALDQLVEFLDGDERRGLVGPRIQHPDGSTQSFASDVPRPPGGRVSMGARFRRGADQSPAIDHSTEPVRCEVIHGSAMVARAEALERIGCLPVETFMYGEELILGHRMATAGWECWYLPDVIVTHLDDVSADREFRKVEKSLRKRRGHIVARRLIWRRGEFVQWSLLQMVSEMRHAARSMLHGDFATSRVHVELAQLHAKTGLAQKAAARGARNQPETKPQR